MGPEIVAGIENGILNDQSTNFFSSEAFEKDL